MDKSRKLYRINLDYAIWTTLSKDELEDIIDSSDEAFINVLHDCIEEKDPHYTSYGTFDIDLKGSVRSNK